MHFRCLTVCMCSWAEIVSVWSQNASRLSMLLCEFSSGNDDILRKEEWLHIFLPKQFISSLKFIERVANYRQARWALNQSTKRSCECLCTRIVLLFGDLEQRMIWPSSRVGPKRHAAADRSLRPRILNLGQFDQPISTLDRAGEPIQSPCEFSATSHFLKKLIWTGRYEEFESCVSPPRSKSPEVKNRKRYSWDLS